MTAPPTPDNRSLPRRALAALWRAVRRHPKVTAAVVVALLVIGGVGAIVDRTVLSPTDIPMPAVVGVRLDEAHDRLDALGLQEVDDHDAFEDRLIIIDSNWTVVRQEPKAGTLINRYTHVTLRAGKTDEDVTTKALGRPLATQSGSSGAASPGPTTTVTVTASPPGSPTPSLPKDVVEFATWWRDGAGENFAAVTEVLGSLQGSGVQTPADLIPYCRRLGDAVLVANGDLPSPDDDTTDALRLAYTFYARAADNCISGDLITSKADIELGAEQVDKATARLRELLGKAGITPP